MRIVTSTLSIEDATALSEFELIQARDRLTEDKDSMTAQINNDTIGDPDWKRRIQLALAHRKRAIRAINSLIGIRKRERAHQHSREYTQVFAAVCKEHLGREVYMDMIAKTREVMLADA